jgi:hypothetical protein
MRRSILICVLALIAWAAVAAGPGDAWLTDDLVPGTSDGMQWLADQDLCPVPPAKLAQAVRALQKASFVALNSIAAQDLSQSSCIPEHGLKPYLVRGVSYAGDGKLGAGRLGDDVWVVYAGLGSNPKFEQAPVVVYLAAAPAKVHVAVAVVE